MCKGLKMKDLRKLYPRGWTGKEQGEVNVKKFR